MSIRRVFAPNQVSPGTVSERLDSWKEIAAYFRRDESTVRRWEKDGLPVHRHRHKSKAAVFAYRAELEAWWKQEPALQETATAQAAERPWFRRQATAVGVFVAAVLCAVLLIRALPFGREIPARASISPTPFMSSESELSYASFSPDGTRLAFAWANPRGMELYVKAVGSESPLRLTHTAGVENFAPAWSPDGREVAFLRTSAAQAGVYVMSASGGVEQQLLALRPDRYYALDWSPDGKSIAFARRESENDPYCIYLLSRATAEQRQITFPSRESSGDLHFAFSPDGRSLAFIHYVLHPGASQMSIEVTPLDAKGEPRVIASYPEWIGNLAWSADSKSLLITGNEQGRRRLWRLDVADGHKEAISESGEDAYFPTVARRGNRMAYMREIEDTDLWRAELASPTAVRSAPVRLSISTRVEGVPRFSPDGKKIAFLSYRSGHPEVWTSDPDGGNATQLTSLGITAKPEWPSWSPDGKTIAFAGGGPFQLVPASGGKPRRISPELTQISSPTWSRDGNWMYVCQGGPGGGAHIWRVPTSGGSPVHVVSNGLASMESADGKFLYFTRAGVSGIWRVPVNGGAESLIVAGQKPEFSGYWSVVEDGIYFLEGVESKPTISFFSFRTQRSKPVLALPSAPDAWRGGLTVSADRRWLVFSAQQYASSEIMVAENYR